MEHKPFHELKDVASSQKEPWHMHSWCQSKHYTSHWMKSCGSKLVLTFRYPYISVIQTVVNCVNNQCMDEHTCRSHYHAAYLSILFSACNLAVVKYKVWLEQHLLSDWQWDQLLQINGLVQESFINATLRWSAGSMAIPDDNIYALNMTSVPTAAEKYFTVRYLVEESLK